MTDEKLITIFEEEFETEYNIDIDNVFEGLKIMSKYINNLIGGADHDIIYGPDISELVDEGITKEDCITLSKLGWHVEDDSYLAHYV